MTIILERHFEIYGWYEMRHVWALESRVDELMREMLGSRNELMQENYKETLWVLEAKFDELVEKMKKKTQAAAQAREVFTLILYFEKEINSQS